MTLLMMTMCVWPMREGVQLAIAWFSPSIYSNAYLTLLDHTDIDQLPPSICDATVVCAESCLVFNLNNVDVNEIHSMLQSWLSLYKCSTVESELRAAELVSIGTPSPTLTWLPATLLLPRSRKC